MSSSKQSTRVAIIGGGFAGLSLAIGLQKYAFIDAQVFEAGRQFSEVGAGVVMNPNSQRAMACIDPRILDGYNRRAAFNVEPADENGLYPWMTIYKGQAPDANEFVISYKHKTRGSTIHRAHFLDELVKLVEPKRAHFGKKLEYIVETDDLDDPLVLHFADGSTEATDMVIGADGVHSVVRKHILGPDDPAVRPVFTNNVMYRGTVPIEVARAKLGDIQQKAGVRCGKDAHVLAWPMVNMTIYYIGVNVFNVKSWDHEKWTVPADVKGVKALVQDWDEMTRKQVELLPEDGSTSLWSIWDMPPARTYYNGLVAMMGDAAHGTSPHQGAGAGMAIEDALVLERLLGEALDPAKREGSKLTEGRSIPLALQAYDAVRRFRSQKVVTTSRESGRIMACSGPPEETTAAEIRKKMEGRQNWIWDLDQEGQVKDALQIFTAAKQAVELRA